MAIHATSPTTLPAATIAAQTFDSWWMTSFIGGGPGPMQPWNIKNVTLRKYSSTTGALSPNVHDTVTLALADILNPTVQAQYNLLGPAVAAILAAAQQVATAMGKL